MDTTKQDAPLFCAADIIHRLPGRVRIRYRLAPGKGADDLRLLPARLSDWQGVESARLNMGARSLIVQFDAAMLPEAVLEEKIRHIGGDAATPGNPGCHPCKGAGAANPETGRLLVGLALLVLLPLLPIPLKTHATLFAALPLLREARDDLKEHGITSHVLEALAVSISILRRDYGAAAATTFMLAIGEYLEASIARRSDALLKTLLRPDIGQIWIEENGMEHQIDASQLKVGMTVIIGAGATLPVDGTVLGGEAMLNEASMTGEGRPVRKVRGDSVLSGTVVEEGRLRIYAEQVGEKTAAARIADYVERSLAAKSQAQLDATRLADRLVPAVLGLAGTSWLLTGDWQRAAAVLQADYSCALKLATPVAFKAAMYRSGQQHILFKGGDVMEKLAQADTFVFDKTGTLTTGQLVVTDALTFDERYSPHDIIDLAASVEEHYFHPLALAVVEAARKNHGRHFDHKEVEFIAAHGVASTIDGQRIVVGSRHFVEEDEGIPVTAHNHRIADLYREGKTLLYIGFGHRLVGIIALKDELRTDAAATLQHLRQLGARHLVMLTGDHPDRAAELATQLGLDEYHAGLLPEGKVAHVKAMTAAGRRIAFIGDGINDAPALAGAHVGIAMQRGADIARITADIALLQDDISLVAQAKAIANRAMERIDANYRLSIATNTGILVGAALGKIPPVATSIAHNGSTIAVLLNALRP